MKSIGIFGTSGMARETGDVAIELGLRPIYVAYDRAAADAWTGADEVVVESEVEHHRDMAFVIGIGEGARRAAIAERYRDRLRFANLVHPSATFGRGQRERLCDRQGVVVCAGVRFTTGIDIGDFTIFNLNATVSHDCTIGDFVTVSPGATILGNVAIGAGAWIGAGAVLNQGDDRAKLVIGAGTMIGSGAVVTRSAEPHSVYVGVPARKIR